MKKHLSLIIAICISVSSFAAPWDIKIKPVNHAAWDEPLKQTKPFDAYCDFYMGEVTGNWPAQTFSLHATLNQEPGVPWMVQIQVFGVWYDSPYYPNGGDYKVFTILYNSAQWNKTIQYPLRPAEAAYPGVMDLIYDGPQ